MAEGMERILVGATGGERIHLSMAHPSACCAEQAIYLDNNATTQPLGAVVDRVTEVLRSGWGNPSSLHRSGQAARGIIETARRTVAELIGAGPAEVIWTSGATEALDLGIRGIVNASPAARRVVLSTAVEHESVRDCLSGLVAMGRVEVVHLPIDRDGVVEVDEARELIERHRDDAALIAVQWANNETGVIQPIGAIGRLARARELPFLVDGTQWVGKMPVRVDPAGGDAALGSVIDLLAFSAHKMHGPKGVGALYVRRGVRLTPTLRGVQERERRGGTENVPGIAGFAAAAEATKAWLSEGAATNEVIGSLEARRTRFERALLEALQPTLAGVRINGVGAARLWNTTNLALPGLEAEAVVLGLSERGVAVSAGAACSSGSLEPSVVLRAMGLDEAEVAGSIRLSLARMTSDDELVRCAAVMAEVVRGMVRVSGEIG